MVKKCSKSAQNWPKSGQKVSHWSVITCGSSVYVEVVKNWPKSGLNVIDQKVAKSGYKWSTIVSLVKNCVQVTKMHQSGPKWAKSIKKLVKIRSKNDQTK